MERPDEYDGNIELGIQEGRVPEYAWLWRVARWIGGGKTAEDIQRMPYWQVQQAQVMMAAEAQIERNRDKQRQSAQEGGGPL